MDPVWTQDGLTRDPGGTRDRPWGDPGSTRVGPCIDRDGHNTFISYSIILKEI